MPETPTTLEQALQTAIGYETRVRDLYKEAVEKATEEKGKAIFSLLAQEEQDHLDYLNSRLDQWQKTGAIQAEKLTSRVPSRRQIAAGIKKLAKKMSDHDWGVELGLLKRALDVERETGAFYKRIVSELESQGQDLFSQFLEIEDAHYDIVQAQIDALEGMGFWFDFMEFDLEA